GVVRRLFKWGLADVIDRSDPAFTCLNDETGSCVIWPDCPCAADAGGEPGHVTLLDAMRMKARVDEKTWASEMLCLSPTRAHLVYPEFDRTRHVTRDDGDGERAVWVGGMDFGFRGETAVLVARLDGSGVLTVTDEFVASETVVGVFADWLVGLARPAPDGGVAWVGVDPAGHNRSSQTGSSEVRVLRDAGLRVRSKRRPLVEGIRHVRTRLAPALGEPTVLIHERCSRLIEALETYHYDESDPTSDKPIKDGPDHACDALRYLIQNLDGSAAGTAKSSYL
ncbi:MAG: hypothetical protein AAF602_32475, partial [Myxococcota bacterium]